MNELSIAIVSVLAGSVAGGIIGYFISSMLSFKEKRRELILAYLIEAYKALENAAHRDVGEELEKAIGTIQLFGTVEQIELAKKFARNLAEHKNADYNDLIYDLRNSLRRELKLGKYEGNVTHLRTYPE